MKKDSPARSPEYLAFVRRRPCIICMVEPPTQAHHWGKHGMGTKASDYETVPLCWKCHHEWHCGKHSKTTESHQNMLKHFRAVSAALNKAYFAKDAF